MELGCTFYFSRSPGWAGSGTYHLPTLNSYTRCKTKLVYIHMCIYGIESVTLHSSVQACMKWIFVADLFHAENPSSSSSCSNPSLNFCTLLSTSPKMNSCISQYLCNKSISHKYILCELVGLPYIF